MSGRSMVENIRRSCGGEGADAATLNVERWVDQILLFIPMFVAGIITFLVFLGLAYIARRVVRHVFERRKLNPDVEKLVEQATFAFVLILGLLTGLGTMGADVGALIASLGLVGFAVGFALKDAVSNYLAGILILLYQPFGRRDKIAVAGHEGVVIGIDMRYTILDSETRRILVPNSQLFSNVVVVEKSATAPDTSEVSETPPG